MSPFARRRLIARYRPDDTDALLELMQPALDGRPLSGLEHARLAELLDAGTSAAHHMLEVFLSVGRDAGSLAELRDRLSLGERTPWVALELDGGIDPAFRDALIAYARSGTAGSEACIEVIAAREWEVAREIAETTPPPHGPLHATLRRFYTRDDFHAAVAALGLDAGASLATTLYRQGAAGSPHSLRHDSLYLAAELASPELDEVAFVIREAQSDDEATQVEAWLGPSKYVLTLPVGRDVDAPGAMLGLLNVLMRERPATRRFFTVETCDEAEALLFAVEPALHHRLADAGFLLPLSAGAATRNTHEHPLNE
ncbi:MAG: hypothetical protein JNK82_37915 [Myxococcaceae bacterium]|nr:hypothetical protein [Myxococcaceae bacterium]